MDLQNISSRPNKSARLGKARKDGWFSKRIITPECPKHSGLGIHSFIICPDSHHRFLFPSPPRIPEYPQIGLQRRWNLALAASQACSDPKKGENYRPLRRNTTGLCCSVVVLFLDKHVTGPVGFSVVTMSICWFGGGEGRGSYLFEAEGVLGRWWCQPMVWPNSFLPLLRLEKQNSKLIPKFTLCRVRPYLSGPY